MVISNWTNTSISVVANLFVDLEDGYQAQLGLLNTFLSPLSDVSTVTFPAAAPAMSGCPISPGDNLYFTVANPQGGGPPASLPPIQVSPVGTAPL